MVYASVLYPAAIFIVLCIVPRHFKKKMFSANLEKYERIGGTTG